MDSHKRDESLSTHKKEIAVQLVIIEPDEPKQFAISSTAWSRTSRDIV